MAIVFCVRRNQTISVRTRSVLPVDFLTFKKSESRKVENDNGMFDAGVFH